MDLNKLKFTPGGAFGSCRLKLKDPKKNKKEFQRILEVFKAHNIGYFFYKHKERKLPIFLQI